MADFNQILTPGDVDAGIINVVNEIPEGSCHKIEWNRKVAALSQRSSQNQLTMVLFHKL